MKMNTFNDQTENDLQGIKQAMGLRKGNTLRNTRMTIEIGKEEEE